MLLDLICTRSQHTAAPVRFHIVPWVPDMSEEDAKQLVRDAIRAGIFNDMGSEAMWTWW